ncbi:MAG: hypothetical protein QGG81_05405 [Acidimicrobiales bacterium]|nr:hypothetical protein [Acidimicrobiales bacterium]
MQTGGRLANGGSSGPIITAMKKLLMLVALAALVAVAVRKVRSI